MSSECQYSYTCPVDAVVLHGDLEGYVRLFSLEIKCLIMFLMDFMNIEVEIVLHIVDRDTLVSAAALRTEKILNISGRLS